MLLKSRAWPSGTTATTGFTSRRQPPLLGACTALMEAAVCWCSEASCKTPPACTTLTPGQLADSQCRTAAAASSCTAASQMRSVTSQHGLCNSDALPAGGGRRPDRPSRQTPAAWLCCSQLAVSRPSAPMPPVRAQWSPAAAPEGSPGSLQSKAADSSLAAWRTPDESCWPWQAPAESQAAAAPPPAANTSTLPAAKAVVGCSLAAQRSMACRAACIVRRLLASRPTGAGVGVVHGAIVVSDTAHSPLAAAACNTCMALKHAAWPASLPPAPDSGRGTLCWLEASPSTKTAAGCGGARPPGRSARAGIASAACHTEV